MVNEIVFQGRLAADISLSTTASGVSWTEFTVCWSDKYKEIETKCFLRCKAWRSTADFLSKYFSKGKMIVIQGRMVTEEWETNGEKKSRMICNVDKVHFCRSNTDSSGPSQPASQRTTGDEDFMNIPDGLEDDELPFN